MMTNKPLASNLSALAETTAPTISVMAMVEKAGRKGGLLGADCTVPRDIDWQRLDWVREAAV